MLTEPAGLQEDLLAAVLASEWNLAAASMTYRAVGFGSYHWEVTDASGTRWFVTADDLDAKRSSAQERREAPLDRLRASLTAAGDLRGCGRDFVVAPLLTISAEPLARANDQFAVALYPFVDGQTFEWGDFGTPGHRRAMLDLVIAIHTAPSAAGRHAIADDYAIPWRSELEAALDAAAGGPGFGAASSAGLGAASDSAGDVAACGPYARPTALLLAESAVPIRQLLARYDDLVRESTSQPARAVLTHGEPHPGNTILTSTGWRLIDWDTVLIAQPERDLWSIDPGDGSIFRAYAAATCVTPLAAALELYRIRWDLSELAGDVARLRGHHSGTADDRETWDVLQSLISRISSL